MNPWRATSLVLLLTSCFALVLSTARCGGGDDAATPSDSGTEARAPRFDANAPILDAGDDAPSTPAYCVPEGGTYSDWPGWQRVTAFDPCCAADVAVDVDAAVPQLVWQACTNDAGPSCQELVVDWPSSSPIHFNQAFAAHDATGKASLLYLSMQTGDSAVEDNLYRASDQQPVAGWRLDESTVPCGILTLGGASTLTLGGYPSSPQLFSIATGTVDALLTHPHFTPLPADYLSVSSPYASDTTFAFELQPMQAIGRMDVATRTFVKTKPGSGLNIDAVEGNDVFAEKFDDSTTGWGELYLVKNDGSIALLRAKPNTHVRTLRSDGVRLYWTEAYGGTSPFSQQPILEVWSAPYTNDPATLAATATKVGQATTSFNGLASMAFDGYVTISLEQDQTWVVRVSDGASQIIRSGPGRSWEFPILVSATEVWSTVGTAVSGPSGIALVRQQLAPWP